jgi:glutaminyl-peptide cyclotransferase
MRSHNGTARRSLAALAVALLASACGVCCGERRVSEPEAAQPQRKGVSHEAASCIDGERALAAVRKLAAIGPRTPGSPAQEEAREFIETELRAAGAAAKRQGFTAFTPHPDLPKVALANITADIAGPGKTVILGGHYDTKLLAGVAFVGANDGGSSAALLLEIARCLALKGSPAAVRLAFFDGEEAFVDWSDADSLYGSKRMAADLSGSPEREGVAAMVNVDMVGDRDLGLVRETLSTPWVFEALVRSAERQGLGRIFSDARGAVEDDHVPFLRIGVPAADLIDFTYGASPGANDYWHTAADTPDKLSAESLAAVGRTVVGALAELSKGAPSR